MEKMDKKERIEFLLAKEKEALIVAHERKAKIEKKIDEIEKKIERYSTLSQNRKFSEATDILDVSGLSFDEVLEAIKTGDLLHLQEKIENKRAQQQKTEEAEKSG